MTKINNDQEFIVPFLHLDTEKTSIPQPFQKDSISSAESDPYAFDVRASFAPSQPHMRPTDVGCTQTDSGCYQTQSGCYQTQSGCRQTDSGC